MQDDKTAIPEKKKNRPDGRVLRRKRMEFKGRIDPESARDRAGQSIVDAQMIDEGLRASNLPGGGKMRSKIRELDEKAEEMLVRSGEFEHSAPITRHFAEKGMEIRESQAVFERFKEDHSKAPPAMSGPLVDWEARRANIEEIKKETRARFARFQNAIDKAMAFCDMIVSEISERGIALDSDTITKMRQKAHFAAISDVAKEERNE